MSGHDEAAFDGAIEVGLTTAGGHRRATLGRGGRHLSGVQTLLRVDAHRRDDPHRLTELRFKLFDRSRRCCRPPILRKSGTAASASTPALSTSR
jgi:hypothetical protein